MLGFWFQTFFTGFVVVVATIDDDDDGSGDRRERHGKQGRSWGLMFVFEFV